MHQNRNNNDRNELEEVIIDIDAERERRIQREVVRITPVERYHHYDDVDDIAQEEAYSNPFIEAEEEEARESGEMQTQRTKSLWQHITTGTFLTDGAASYYRSLLIIAAMYFLSIFLNFVQLNSDREYRSLQNYATVLNERAVLKEEERFSLSSKSYVEERLKSYGIDLIDLSKHSRLIEK